MSIFPAVNLETDFDGFPGTNRVGKRRRDFRFFRDCFCRTFEHFLLQEFRQFVIILPGLLKLASFHNLLKQGKRKTNNLGKK